jgi:hypothetical protein
MSSRKKLKPIASGMEVAEGVVAAHVAPEPAVRAMATRRQFSAAFAPVAYVGRRGHRTHSI